MIHNIIHKSYCAQFHVSNHSDGVWVNFSSSSVAVCTLNTWSDLRFFSCLASLYPSKSVTREKTSSVWKDRWWLDKWVECVYECACVCLCQYVVSVMWCWGRAGKKKKLYSSLSCGQGAVSADIVKYWCGINSRLIREAELIRKRLISRVFFSVEGRFWSEPYGWSLWCAGVHRLLNMNYFCWKPQWKWAIWWQGV